eukprot:TRINITY_DN4230_c0_g1_i6.p1 TRINITY_DN4230_c0_g1~~TRINITY_DN4230_c0_g1_i6.p1  ORF type:complete len:224 (+),score=40.91 TRINITY_DN4230_c0_g1_i6:127-798(+)
MRVYVVLLTGGAVVLEAGAEQTVRGLKRGIAAATKLHSSLQRVCCGGRALDDGMTLRECAGAANVLTLDMSPRSLPVAVRTLAGEFDVEARTVPELRERIQQRTGINAARQRLFVGDEELSDNRVALASLQSEGALEVDVKEVSVDGMFVLVKTQRNKTLELSCNTDDTILTLKRRMERAHGLAVKEQRLIIFGTQLQGSVTLREYGITEGTRLWLVYRLRGS